MTISFSPSSVTVPQKQIAAGYADHYAQYDRSHARWLRHAGGEAQCAFEGAAAALLRPGARMIDVACGTGVVARRLLAGVNYPVDLTLLDASKGMLSYCADLPARRVLGRLEELPFPAQSFDLVTCAWGIETVESARTALQSLLRICAPEGAVCIVFCADRPARSLWAQGMRTMITYRGLGQFLDVPAVTRAAKDAGAVEVRWLHCTGPAAAALIRPGKSA